MESQALSLISWCFVIFNLVAGCLLLALHRLLENNYSGKYWALGRFADAILPIFIISSGSFVPPPFVILFSLIIIGIIDPFAAHIHLNQKPNSQRFVGILVVSILGWLLLRWVGAPDIILNAASMSFVGIAKLYAGVILISNLKKPLQKRFVMLPAILIIYGVHFLSYFFYALNALFALNIVLSFLLSLMQTFAILFFLFSYVIKQLSQTLLTDPLTGLYNRRFLSPFTEQAFERFNRYQHPLTIVIIDIDHFKQVNDTFGHQVGDEAITQVSACIKSFTRTSDVCARMGGEEFIIILNDTPLSGAVLFSNRLRLAIRDVQIDTPRGPIHITVSIGIAEVSSEDSSIQQAMCNADKAMYKAKMNGRNQVQTYDPDDYKG